MTNLAQIHPDQERLTAFGLGYLDEAESEVIHQHLETCHDCRTIVEQLADDTLAGLVRAAAPSPDAPTCDGLHFSETSEETFPEALVNHPRYRLLEVLGSGGMGTVYRAQHQLMDRIVALKVIHPKLVNKPSLVDRFLREFKAAARLSHPNIVTAFDADQAGDVHFLAMEYVEGISLARLVAERGPLPVEEACDYVRQAALGLQHALEKGMVHRDIKPQNLMVVSGEGSSTSTPHPSPLTPHQIKILDFGLARFASEEAPLAAESVTDIGAATGSMTATGMVLGTADYIAPEQADEPHAADIRADIYSLGCTLYFLLTGQPPFPEGTLMQKLTAHKERTPQPLASFRQDIPDGLQAILDRMTAKNSDQRYLTPIEVARALEPFCQRRAGGVNPPLPITGGLTPRARRRGPLVAVLTLLFAGLVAAAGVVFYIVTDNGTIEIRTDDENIKIIAERNGKQITILDPKSKQTWVVDTGKYTVRLEGAPEGLEIELPQTFTMKRGDKQVVVVKRVKGPEVSVKPDDKAKVGEVRRFEGHEDDVVTVAFSPDGTLALSAGGLSRNQDTGLRLWEVKTGKLVRLLEGHTAAVFSVAFSRDGKFALSGSDDQTVRLWDVETGKECKRFAGHTDRVNQVAFFPDEKRGLSCSRDKTVRLWDLGTGKELNRFDASTEEVRTVAITPDGKQFLSGSFDNMVNLWDVETGKVIRRLEGHTGGVISVAIAPDGRRAVSGGYDQTVRLWDLGTGKEVQCFKGHGNVVHAVAFAPDGRCAVSGGYDQTVRLWDLGAGKELQTFWRHTKTVLGIGVSPDSRYVLSSGADQTVRLWRLPEPPPDKPPEKPGLVRLYKWARPQRKDDPAPVYAAAFSPDGRLHAAATDGGLISVWETATGKQRLEVSRPETRFHSVAFTADGAHLLAGHGGRNLSVLDVATGKEVRKFERQLFQPVLLPNGKAVISAEADDNVVRVVELSTGKELTRLEGMAGVFCFTIDGKWAVGRAETQIRAWHLSTGRAMRRYGNKNSPDVLNFSPDCKQLLVSDHMVLRLWDMATGAELRSFHGHTASVIGAVFLPNGRIASWSAHHKILRVWDAQTGKELQSHNLAVDPLTPRQPFALTPDGRRFLTNHANGSIRVRDLATGQEQHQFAVWSNPQVVAVSPDGRYASCGSDRDGVYLFRLPDPPPQEKVGELHRLRWNEGHRFCGAQVSPDGRYFLATRNNPNAVRVWDMQTGKQLHQLEGYLATFTRDSKQVITGDWSDVFRVYDLDSGKVVRQFQGKGELWGMGLLGDGSRMLAETGTTFSLWDPVAGKELFTAPLNNNTERLHMPDGPHALITRRVDGAPLRALDVRTGKEVPVTSELRAVVERGYSWDGRRFAIVKDGFLRVHEAASGKEIDKYALSPDETWALSGDGRRLAIYSPNEIRVGEVGTGRPAQRSVIGKDRTVLPTMSGFSRDGRFAIMVWNPDDISVYRLTED